MKILVVGGGGREHAIIKALKKNEKIEKEIITMEKLIEILEDIKPDVDYEGCENLIDGHYLDSLSIISLIAEIEDAFDVTVPAVEVVPANFNSVKAMWSMIERLQEEE